MKGWGVRCNDKEIWWRLEGEAGFIFNTPPFLTCYLTNFHVPLTEALDPPKPNIISRKAHAKLK